MFVISEGEKNVSSHLQHVQIVHYVKVFVVRAIRMLSTSPETETKFQPGLHLPLINDNPVFMFFLLM